MFNAHIADNNEIVLSGRFDASQEEKAKKFFNQVMTTSVVNFSELEYISSSGLGVLIMTQKRLGETGHRLKMVKLNKHIRDVFTYAGFDKIFEIE